MYWYSVSAATPRVGPVARVRAQSVWAPCTVKDGEILRGGVGVGVGVPRTDSSVPEL